MKFNFKIQQYQTDAVDAVVNVFAGQPYSSGVSYIRDTGTLNQKPQQLSFLTLADNPEQMELEDLLRDSGYKNEAVALSDNQLLQNIHTLQSQNNIKLSPELVHDMGRCSLDIEMETGTGKTYVYIKTMFELNKKYGWSKFIVVVPSIAIREGVKKSFEITTDHFMEYYGKKARFFVYNSSNLNQLDNLRVRYKQVFVFLRLHIAVSGKGSNKISVTALYIQRGTGLDGNIPAVGFVHNVFDGYGQIVTAAFMGGVDVIRDGNKADPISWEYPAQVASGFNVLSSQAGEVLYNDTVDLAIGDVLHHFLKRRTVKNDTAVTIVDFFGYDLDVRVSFNEVLNQLPLVGNAVALAGAIICVRQTNVSCCLIFWHEKALLSSRKLPQEKSGFRGFQFSSFSIHIVARFWKKSEDVDYLKIPCRHSSNVTPLLENAAFTTKSPQRKR